MSAYPSTSAVPLQYRKRQRIAICFPAHVGEMISCPLDHAEISDEASDRVHCTDDRTHRSGTAGVSPQLPELLDSKSSYDKRAEGRYIFNARRRDRFVIDEAAKKLTFSDNRPLTVTRLDRYWISANRDGINYEFDRKDGTLTYASSTMQDGVATTIVGSGQCAILPTPIQ